MIRPTRVKTSRLRVLVVTVRPAGEIVCHHPTASQAPLAAKRPDGMVAW